MKESNAKQQEQKHQSQAPFRWKMSNKQLTSCLSNLLSHDSSSRGTFAFSLALSFSFASLTLSSFSSFSTFAWYVGSTPTWKNDFPQTRATLGLPGYSRWYVLPKDLRTHIGIPNGNRPSHDILEILFFKNPQFESQFQVHVGFLGSLQLALDLLARVVGG